MKKLTLAAMAFATVLFTACGGGSTQDNSSDSSSDTTASAPTEAAAPAAASDDNQGNTISLTGDDQMKFSETSFTVKAGEPVTLKFQNVGKLPAQAMSHDVVILKPGTSFKDFGTAVTKAGSMDKLSADLKADVVAETKMLGPGESDEITFTLEPGEYPFLCTFPGHFMSMNGTITAK